MVICIGLKCSEVSRELEFEGDLNSCRGTGTTLATFINARGLYRFREKRPERR